MPILPKNNINLPTVFVILGITGDLMRSKLLYALFELYRKNLLPKMFQVVGFSRKQLRHEELRDYLRGIMTEKDFKDKDKWDSFLTRFFYVQGHFDDKSAYQHLAEFLGRIDGEWKVCSSKLYYLAVPPQYYRTILMNIQQAGLTIPCSPEEGWTRVILEKPFGRDLKSAEDLDELLGKLFREEQIYRVDHYLGKETVRNILTFRFSNSFLTPAWNNRYVEKIEISLFEKEGVKTRGEFYDGVGALRDVGQNHLLQLLALFTMNEPIDFQAHNIREKRSEILSHLKKIEGNEVEHYTLRGQYDGYRSESGVLNDSNTETYFKIKLEIQNWQWEGVPVYLESGKAVDKSLAEVRVTFKHQNPCWCFNDKKGCSNNMLVYEIQPHEKITTRFLVKKPGHDNSMHEQDFEFDYQKAFPADTFIEAYEKLILDMVNGDQTLFVSTEEIMNEWHYVEPILMAWQENKTSLIRYAQGEKIDAQIADDKMIATKREVGLVGLGKMGSNVALKLLDEGWSVTGYNRTKEKTDVLAQSGLIASYSLKELVSKLEAPRVIWVMLPAGEVIDEIIFGTDGLASYLQKGDIIVDAGNSFYKDAQTRHKKLKEKGIDFVDVGFSGGPKGARTGGCLMVGGNEDLYKQLILLYKSMASYGGLAHFEGVGAGHFVKMVHNGIEYGMMQALGEGFEILKKSVYQLDLTKVAEVYNHGSVIESKLVGWLHKAFHESGIDLSGISSVVAHTGEGTWTIETAKELGVEVKVIQDALEFRIKSAEHPTFTGKVVSALRGQFGGHKVDEKKVS